MEEINMKKYIAMALALVMVLTLFAGCGKAKPAETAPAETESAQVLPGSALEILETVWAKYEDGEKFPVIGGNIEANIMDAPGNYDLTYAENMTDTRQLYEDYFRFWKRFTYWCKKNGHTKPEYITVQEPQGRGD